MFFKNRRRLTISPREKEAVVFLIFSRKEIVGPEHAKLSDFI